MELSAFSHYKSLKLPLMYTDVRFRPQSHGGNDTADKSITDPLWKYKTHKYNLWSYKLQNMSVIGNLKKRQCFFFFFFNYNQFVFKQRMRSEEMIEKVIKSSFALHSSLLSTCKSLIPFWRIDHRAHEHCDSTSKVTGAVLTHVKNYLPQTVTCEAL